MDTETYNYQVAKLPEDLKRMVDDYSETVDAAKNMEPTFAPLRILSLLGETNDATIDLDNITGVAIELVDDDGDQFQSTAVLRGAQALGRKQADKIRQLTGLVLQQMQLTHPEKSTKTSAMHSAPGDIQ